MSKKKHILRGVGASAVAVTSIISGLSFGSAAIAAAEAPSVSSAKAQRLNPSPPRNIRATQITNYGVDFSFEIPPIPASGYRYTLPCVGPEENPFANCSANLSNGSTTSWRSVEFYGGYGSNWKPGQTRNMVVTTVLKDNNGNDTHGKAYYSVTRPWFLTATAQYSIASDAFRLTGTTKDKDVTVQVSSNGGSTWKTVTSAANHQFDLTLDRDLTAGGTIRVREGLTGDGTAVSLRSAAVTQLAASEANKKRLLSGKATSNAKVHVSASDLASDDYLSFNASANGTFKDIDLSAVPQQVREVTVWQGDNGIRTRVQLPTLLGAVAKDIDIEAGTATLDGFAPEGTTAVDVTWNGVTRDATLNADGSWSFDLTGLELGSNTVRIEAWNGSESYGEFRLDVNLAVAGLTANATFDDDVSKDVTLAGNGQAGATIEVRSGETTVARTTVVQGNTWSVQLPAPDTSGNYDLLVVQKVRGEEHGAEDLTVDYGRGVDITSPVGQADADSNGRIVILGDAQKNTAVELYEVDADGEIVGEALGQTTSTNPTDGDKGTFRIVVNNLDEREYKIVAQQHGKGNNITTSDPVVINPGQSNVVAPTAEVVFDEDLTKNATVTGTGADGATITVKNGSQTLGTTTVTDGAWSLPIDPIGPGSHTLTIEQTGVEGTQTATTVADFGAAVRVTGPAAGTITPGIVDVTGTGAEGAKVTVRAGDQTATGVVENGTFTIPVEIAPSTTAVTLNVSQQAKGNLVTTDDSVLVNPTGAQQQTPVAISEPSVYTPLQNTTVRGTATAYANVRVTNQWGAQVGTAKADVHGKWSFTRQFGPSASYTLTATQTRIDGTTSTSAPFTLDPIGAFRPITVANTNPSQYTPGEAYTISGTATPGAVIRATNQWGATVFETRADQSTGAWTHSRLYGPTASYTLTISQKALDGTTDQISGFQLNPALVWEDATLTSPTDGSTYTPGEVTFTGTGTVGAEITARNQWNVVLGTATVGSDKTWSFKRVLGPTATYEITFTAKKGNDTNTFTATLHGPVTRALTLLSPTPGETYTPGQSSTFTGTASSFAKISAVTKYGTPLFETTERRGRVELHPSVGSHRHLRHHHHPAEPAG